MHAEQLPLVNLLDADALVEDVGADLLLTLVVADKHAHEAALRELQRVLNQIYEHLDKACLVASQVAGEDLPRLKV